MLSDVFILPQQLAGEVGQQAGRQASFWQFLAWDVWSFFLYLYAYFMAELPLFREARNDNARTRRKIRLFHDNLCLLTVRLLSSSQAAEKLRN